MSDRKTTGLPRFTTSLRTKDLECLKKKRARKKTRGRTVAELVQLVSSDCSSQDKQKIEDCFHLLQQSSREIVGHDVDQSAVDSAAVFLFTLFVDNATWSVENQKEIRNRLGPFPASAANEAYKSVMNIITIAPSCKDRDYSEPKEEVREEFGKKIKVHYHQQLCGGSGDREAVPSNGLGRGSSGGYDSLSDDEVEGRCSSIINSELLTGILCQPKPENPAKKDSRCVSVRDAATPPSKPVYSGKYSGEWLQAKCRSCGTGSDWKDLFAAVFEYLSSGEETSSIENDLVELLGFGEIELVQELLTHRETVVASVLQDSSSLLQSGGMVRDKSSLAVSTVMPSSRARPAVGSQVTIQSEQEKQLRKMYRKEEKKMTKQVKDLQSVGVTDLATQLQLLGFDPRELKKERELSLEEASRRPLLTGRSVYRPVDPSAIYPHVYDSMAQAKLTSAFVADSKLAIPADAERKNNSIMEEITIPHTSSAPPAAVGEDRVKVSELDEVAQLAFRGTKSLNRIQSVVFDAAYYTNENLLIAAPTGAGKTNIAMLTVLHEIKSNIVGGVINRDKFKIIYVAPMKALAAEMVRNFGARLEPLGVKVRELTGDMQLTKAEIQRTQMIVTTPEKWDVVTRKATGDVQLAQIVRLLIIDEVHLLHEDRGAVIESLVARTLRQVESSQNMIRIVGLSATLPNYLDVARFLRVNPYQGLFFFDGRFRPVPLSQSFVGVKAPNKMKALRDMDEVCYDKVLENVHKGHQVMVFVHARNATVKTATALRDMAASNGELPLFAPEQSAQLGLAEKQVSRSRNKPLRDLFSDGFSIHHAGMLRPDRNLVERLFSEGLVKVLVCTATLAWGVNLPAHAVIIKGTQIYDSKKGAFVDLGILDVMQIFGRAGRPQFDKFGEGTIITNHDKLSHYLSLMTRQQPIESQLLGGLNDNLNAEISLGTVTTVEEAVQWLSYTYLFIRMRANPLVYGIRQDYWEDDPQLESHRRKVIIEAARRLDRAKMIRFVDITGALHATDMGRTASHYYIKHTSIEMFNEHLKPIMTEAKILATVSKSDEFEQLKVREDEVSELTELCQNCFLPAEGGVENPHGKVNILLQTFISRDNVDSFSLTSDLSYVAQNTGRILRGLFEIALKKGAPLLAFHMLTLCKCVDHRLWMFEHPLKQFGGDRVTADILNKLEQKKATIPRLRDMSQDEIGHLVNHVRMGREMSKLVHAFPMLNLAASIQPITRTVIKVQLTITPDFTWNDRIHGSTSEPWWVWVEDAENNCMYHYEYFLLQKKQVLSGEAQELTFTIPIFEPLPPQYIVRVVSDRWLQAESVVAISFKHLILPELHPPHTKLLDLHPLPVAALSNSAYEQLYSFSHFNPVQTQVFHTLYHSDNNVLLGAPTGSGKTVAAELAIFRVFNCYPGGKAVYIAPLKALVRERIADWKVRLEKKLNRKVVELTGDTSPDIRAIEKADVIVTTPEKWDGISRSWQNRKYVQAMRLLVIDEIHLLGNDRGPVLEVIVSRTNFIASHTKQDVRVVGLSTALANAKDLADWLAIKQGGLFNFHPAVRPVQLEVHIDSFPGKHYCPRMATMNKPSYAAIQTYSPNKPILIFVSSRRQTRLTAFDLVAFLGAENDPKQWLHMDETEMERLSQSVSDPNLRHILSFGIGLHHAGLQEKDRKLVEELFFNQKIQVLIATSTLAWGVNFPAHLVIVKGTEYFDGKTQRYVDYPITDVLQMMGRAGRPQYDDKGVAVILVHDIKKHFYKKFLYEPFPVESNLLEVFPDHLNAEVVAGTITSKQDAMDYVTWTYFFRRLLMNPSYYHLEEAASINHYLSEVVTKALGELQESYCIDIEEDERTVHPLTLGCISSFYYLHHKTVRLFRDRLAPQASFEDLLHLLCDSCEYNELPVRHNEDELNKALSQRLPLAVSPPDSFDSPHTKTHLLLQAHFERAELPIADYATDTKSVLDQALRILQSLIDICADEGWLSCTLRVMHLVQMCTQGRWISDPSLLTLPHLRHSHLLALPTFDDLLHPVNMECVSSLPELLYLYEKNKSKISAKLTELTGSKQQADNVCEVLSRLPIVCMRWRVVHKSCDAAPAVAGEGLNPQARQWVDVSAAEDDEVIVQVELLRKCAGKKVESRIYAPRFPKAKEESWWLVLGAVDSGELVALKRLPFFKSRTRASLAFSVPEDTCRQIYSLYLMSDSYLGLDQQCELCLNFIIN